ncbi:hypothetical protein ONZ45_g6431 [Pleurotus djamor]|nr:hypothetical protein ONZ45_g6431 [Pleurotus djamor]
MYKRRIERFEPDELLPAPTTSRPLRPRSRSSVGSTASRTSRTHDGRTNKGKGKARDVSEESISRGPGYSSDGADDGRSSKRRKLELDEADDTDVLGAARSGANSSGHGRHNRKGKGKARQLSAESTSRRSASVASGPSNQVNTDDETTFSPSNPSRDKGKGKMRAEDIMGSIASEDEVDELARTDSDIEPPATQQSTLSQAGSSSASVIDLFSHCEEGIDETQGQVF